MPVSESDIQELVHAFPSCLPIAEIDGMFADPIAICRELNTSAGPIDNFLVTASGLPVLVECKLWRNPEGRREVVGQILDYAKELSRWSSSDLQRDVSRRLGRKDNALLEIVRMAHPDIDEVQFNDALTFNLRKGRFLLLIVGDGIREGVEAIAEYLQKHAGLHFSLGLVELPIFVLPDGQRLVAPRVLARTEVVTRTVLAIPDGYAVQDETADEDTDDVDPERADLQNSQQAFWKEFLGLLRLDDPEQTIPGPARQGYLAFMFPAASGSSWLTVYRNLKLGEVGVFLSSSRNSAGEYAMRAIAEDWAAVGPELGGQAVLTEHEGRPRMIDSKIFGSLQNPDIRHAAFEWLAERVNTFVNVLRPRVRSTAADFRSSNLVA